MTDENIKVNTDVPIEVMGPESKEEDSSKRIPVASVARGGKEEWDEGMDPTVRRSSLLRTPPKSGPQLKVVYRKYIRSGPENAV